MLANLKWGRWVYAVGSNPDAASQAGLPVNRVVLGAFVASGALAGLAGFMFLSRFGTITVVAGPGLELQSVAAAVVGGVNIFGGSGTLFGALLGAVLINLLDQSLLGFRGSASSGATPCSGRSSSSPSPSTSSSASGSGGSPASRVRGGSLQRASRPEQGAAADA